MTAPKKKTTEAKKPLQISPLFTEQEKTELRKLFAAGHKTASIAVIMGRAESTIKRWSVRMGLREKRENIKWTEADVEILKHGIKYGIPIPTIAKTLNRTPGAVALYATKMYKNGKMVRVPDPPEEVAIKEQDRHISQSPSSDLYVQWCKAMRHYAQTEI
jgi:hypothetical protein